MENLQSLKDSIFTLSNTSEAVEKCYKDFLTNFDLRHATIFMGLLDMVERTSRIEEILLVMNYLRFPVKKAFKGNYGSA
ncbi:hypothetical protein PAEPH01_0516 [Pancytospora epiphaga]|nr:hypothetical protein PAEPH01_0516 [Pancytospora epiphaga]